MAFTVIFEAAHINLSGEDKREPHHTDTYTAKSLTRMGYIKINGEWKKKDQQESSSSSEEEEDTQADPLPPSEPVPTHEDIPTETFEEPAQPSEPPQEKLHTESITPSSSIEELMKKMTEDITATIQTSLASFSQTIEEKMTKLTEDVSQINTRLNKLEASSSSHIPPSVNTDEINAIKEIVTKGIDGMHSELQSASLRISKLEDCRRFEDEYAKNLGTLRGEFGRMRGSADNFTKLQADALKELRDDTKTLTSEVSQMWHFLQALLTKVDKLTPQVIVKQEPPP